MSTKSTVEIDIVANAEAYKQSLKAANSDTAEFVKNVRKQNKSLSKNDEVLKQAENAMRFVAKKDRKEALQHEKKLQGLLMEKSKILKDLSRQGKRDSAEAKSARADIKSYAETYATIKTDRERAEETTVSGKLKKAGSSVLSKVGSVAKAGAWAIPAAAAAFAGSRLASGVGDVDDLYKEQREAAKSGIPDYKSRIESQVPALEKYGVNRTQGTAEASMVAKLTGSLEDVLDMNRLAMSANMSSNEASQFLGEQARSGTPQMSGESDRASREREQTRIMKNGFLSGLKSARMPEMFQGITQLLESGQQRSSGNVSAAPYADLIGMLGKFTGKAGFQGARGAATLGKLEAGIAGADVGSAEAAFTRQAYGHGLPGGNTDFYTAEKRRQAGLTDETYGAKNITDLLDHVLNSYGGVSQAAVTATSQISGKQLSLGTAEELLKGYDKARKADPNGDAMKSWNKQVTDAQKKMKSPDERVAEILDDKIFESLKKQAGYDNKIMEDMESSRDFLNKIKQDADKLVLALADNIPALVTKVSQLYDVSKEFFTTVKDKLGMGESKDPEVNRVKEAVGASGLPTLQKLIVGAIAGKMVESKTPEALPMSGAMTKSGEEQLSDSYKNMFNKDAQSLPQTMTHKVEITGKAEIVDTKTGAVVGHIDLAQKAPSTRKINNGRN